MRSVQLTVTAQLSPQLASRVEQAERLSLQGRPDLAAQLFEEVLALAPEQPRAQGFFAMQAFARGDLKLARKHIECACSGEPRRALLQANRALILRALGDADGALEALQLTLEIDPKFAPARLDAAELLDQLGREREAAAYFREALAALPPIEQMPMTMRAKLDHARSRIDADEARLAAELVANTTSLRANHDPGTTARFDECVEILFGRAKPMLPKPGFMYFPKLTPYTFFPREMFDWISRVEAATDIVREEMLKVLAGDDAGFIPYVQKSAADRSKAWDALNFSSDWGAYFLFNQGQRVEKHCDACPQTAALLDSLPLVRIAERGPTAFFSRLKPGAEIPPHHGATNTRVIAHLPLVVPEGCALRVGNDTRDWCEGEVMVFDDSVEHAAWNRSERTRVVLIFDVWNPLLTALERDLVTAATAAFARHHGGRLHDTD